MPEQYLSKRMLESALRNLVGLSLPAWLFYKQRDKDTLEKFYTKQNFITFL